MKPEPPINWKAATILSVMLGAMMVGVAVFSDKLVKEGERRP